MFEYHLLHKDNHWWWVFTTQGGYQWLALNSDMYNMESALEYAEANWNTNKKSICDIAMYYAEECMRRNSL